MLERANLFGVPSIRLRHISQVSHMSLYTTSRKFYAREYCALQKA